MTFLQWAHDRGQAGSRLQWCTGANRDAIGMVSDLFLLIFASLTGRDIRLSRELNLSGSACDTCVWGVRVVCSTHQGSQSLLLVGRRPRDKDTGSATSAILGIS